MPTTWTAESERRLLLSIITVLSPSPPKWEDVVKLMGLDYTAEAVRQKYQKMRKLAPRELNAIDNGDLTTPKKATPRKRKGSTMAEGAVEGEAEEVGKNPAKKGKVKKEDLDADE